MNFFTETLQIQVFPLPKHFL